MHLLHLITTSVILGGCGGLKARSHLDVRFPPKEPLPGFFVCDGDSLTLGNHASNRYESYPEALKRLTGLRAENAGRPGVKPEDMLADAKTGKDPVDQFRADGGMLLAWGGINSYLAEGPQDAFAALSSYVQDRLTKGWRVGVLTLVPSDYRGTEATYEIWRDDFNSRVRSLAGVQVLDVGNIAALRDPHDRTYFDADFTHLVDAGNEAVAAYIANQFRKE